MSFLGAFENNERTTDKEGVQRKRAALERADFCVGVRLSCAWAWLVGSMVRSVEQNSYGRSLKNGAGKVKETKRAGCACLRSRPRGLKGPLSYYEEGPRVFVMRHRCMDEVLQFLSNLTRI